MTEEHYRICPICEAGCGLRVHCAGRSVQSIEANDRDVFSAGHVCAKGLALKELDADPDRLRTPLLKTPDGHREVSWSEAFDQVCARLGAVIDSHGPGAVATYIGNPTAHNIGLALGAGVFARALRSSHIYSAGSVDQLPKQLACELMFGNGMAIPVPDIARADYLLMLGANPLVSNGSLWMVPDFRGKLREFHQRGGRFVTVDPRRTETARLADEHLFIRPGTDAWLLAALIRELSRLGRCLPDRYPVEGAELLFDRLAAVTIEQAAAATGIDAPRIMALARDLDQAQRPVAYGRVGTTIQRHGTLTSFLLEVLNLLLGSLDAPGGAMFPEQAFRAPAVPWNGPSYARYRTRVSGYPEVLGQLPVAALAEEMETPGTGQIRALVCLAGNPILSNPDSDRLARAIEGLDFVLCVDLYHHETSRLADVILPGSSPFEDSHYDHFLGAMGHRNTARYSPPLFAADRPDEWRLMLTLAFILSERQAPTDAALDAFEDQVVAESAAAHCTDPTGPLNGRDVQEVLRLVEPERGVERLLDLGIRAGRFGDHLGRREGLTLATLRDAPHGVDLGQLRAGRLAELVRRPGGFVDLAPAVILEGLAALVQDRPGERPTDELLLIGRRNTRSNNSWLRNLPMLGRGRKLFVLELNPQDAASLGIGNGDSVVVSSEAACVRVQVRLTRDVAPGVAVLPHGFSETEGLWQSHLQSGGNYNRLVPAGRVDGPSATAALNGVGVRLRRCDSVG